MNCNFIPLDIKLDLWEDLPASFQLKHNRSLVRIVLCICFQLKCIEYCKTILSFTKAPCGLSQSQITLGTLSSVQALPLNYPGAKKKCEIGFLSERSHLGLLFLWIESSSHCWISPSQD